MGSRVHECVLQDTYLDPLIAREAGIRKQVLAVYVGRVVGRAQEYDMGMRPVWPGTTMLPVCER